MLVALHFFRVSLKGSYPQLSLARGYFPSHELPGTESRVLKPHPLPLPSSPLLLQLSLPFGLDQV